MSATIFVVGPVTTARGDILKTYSDGSASAVGQVPATAFSDRQPLAIPVVRAHEREWPFGEIRYLERSGGVLYAVAEVSAAARDHFSPAYFSASVADAIRRRTIGGDCAYWRDLSGARLEHLSIGASAAQIGLRPVAFYERKDGGDLGWNTPPAYLQVAKRAAPDLSRTYLAEYLRPRHLVIEDLDPPVEMPEPVAPVQRSLHPAMMPKPLRRAVGQILSVQ
jgi:hypothetical protein